MYKPNDELIINRDEDKECPASFYWDRKCPASFYRDRNSLDCDLKYGHEGYLHWDDMYNLWWARVE